MQGIPRFDLRDYAKDKVAFSQALGKAFHDFGFVRIVGHGIPEDILKNADKAAAKFWALPEAVKDLSVVKGKEGIVGYTRNAEKALGQKAPDIKEEWSVRARMPEINGKVDRAEQYLTVPGIPDFKGSMTALFSEFEKLTLRIMQPFSLYMGEKEDWFADKFDRSHSMMRLLNYPQAGTAADHIDINLLTWLRAEKPGLFIKARDNTIHEVTAEPGELLLNGGMELGVLTNTDLQPSWHKVEAKEARRTIVFFAHPNPDYVLQPLPKFAGNPPAKVPDYFPEPDQDGVRRMATGPFVRKEVAKIFAPKP